MNLADIATALQGIRSDLRKDNEAAHRRAFTEVDCLETVQMQILSERYESAIENEAGMLKLDFDCEGYHDAMPNVCAILRAYQRADVKGIVAEVARLKMRLQNTIYKWYEDDAYTDAVARSKQEPDVGHDYTR